MVWIAYPCGFSYRFPLPFCFHTLWGCPTLVYFSCPMDILGEPQPFLPSHQLDYRCLVGPDKSVRCRCVPHQVLPHNPTLEITTMTHPMGAWT